MPYEITHRSSFLHEFSRVPREIQDKISKRADAELRDDPATPRGDTIKKLKGFENLWRYRLGDYRLIYAVHNGVVQYLVVGPRGKVYEQFRYDPENPDTALCQAHEALLFPNLAGAAKPDLEQLWRQIAERQQAELEQKKNPTLPEKLTSSLLGQWGVPAQYHGALIVCRTEDDLLEVDVPGEWKERVLNCLWPKPVEAIAEQPVLVLQSGEDLISFVEGKLSSFLLKLDPEQEKLVDWALEGPTLIKGGPGSGKSTVAMYRVRSILARAGETDRPAPSVLFTTYTNALVSVSRQLLAQLLGGMAGRWQVSTVDSLAMDIFKEASKSEPRVAPIEEWKQAIRAARLSSTPDFGNALENRIVAAALASLDDDYLLNEMETVIEGRGYTSLQQYLAADRQGLGKPFDKRMRRAVWELYVAVKRILAGKGLMSWGDIRHRANEAARSQRVSKWDHVIVDEAQDLTPMALSLCVELAADPRHIFLAADSSQSIYNRGFSYSKVHEQLDVSHRTRILRRNYRTTREIALGALEVIQGFGAGDEETLAQTSIHYGPKPVLYVSDQEGAQVDRIIDYILRQAKNLELSAGAAAVLCPTNQIAEHVAALCTRKGLPAKYMSGRALKLETPEVKVMTIHSAKGLEFPIVAIPMVHQGVLPRALPDGSSDDPEKHEQQQRRLLFVGLTRAMRRLIVTTAPGEKRSLFLASLTDKNWDIQSE
ncbi:hypothetical protein FJY94_04840 [Candidatus Kaiserbacteria bacterium]|nr:hypothetical protein [Candidatus Kaiserbacteria bacterium]